MPRLTEEQQLENCRLALRQVPHVQIAERVGVHRNTVSRVVGRTRAALSVNDNLEQERASAIEVYRELQRSAWEAVETATDRGRSTASLLGEVRQAQQRIDTLMGLVPLGPDDPALELAQFKAVVVDLIRTEAPALAPVLAQRMLEARDDR